MSIVDTAKESRINQIEPYIYIRKQKSSVDARLSHILGEHSKDKGFNEIT